MTWEKTNSSLGSKKETAIAFAEWLWKFQTGEQRDFWSEFDVSYAPDTEVEEEKSTEQMYNIWNKLNNQETN